MPRVISKPRNRDRCTLLKTENLDSFPQGAPQQSDMVLHDNQFYEVNIGGWSSSISLMPIDALASPDDVEQLKRLCTAARHVATADELALINRVMANKRDPFTYGGIDQTTEGFGAFETIGTVRPTQEDALVWQTFDDNELSGLSPEEIGEHLQSAYKVLDNANEIKQRNSGTTASTTVIQGEHIITATLADASSFIVLCNAENQVLHVERLNQRTHNPNLAEEKERIEAAGGFVVGGRVMGILNVSRAIGDHSIKGTTSAKLVASDADIHITSIREIAQRNDIDPANCKVQIITTCDGYTDPASKGSEISAKEKQEHEAYLQAHLEAILHENPDANEAEIASKLTEKALTAHSRDNISVAVQTIKRPGRPATFHGMMGVYDGHAGPYAAHYVADHICDEIIKQCRPTPAVYSAEEASAPYRHEDVPQAPSAATIVQDEPMHVLDVPAHVPNKHEKPSTPHQKNRIATTLLSFGLATAGLASIGAGLLLTGFLLSPIGMPLTLGLLGIALAVGLITAAGSKFVISSNNPPSKTSKAAKPEGESAHIISKQFDAVESHVPPTPVSQHYPPLFTPPKGHSRDLDPSSEVRVISPGQ